MGAQSHALTSAFDYEQQKVEERGKNGVPNKRTRTSMVDQKADVRPNTPARSSGSVERPNGNALQGADRVLPVVADGWEKGKMKKKRSGIKADTAPSSSSVSAKPVDGSREPKQGMHPRGLPDARSRTNDPYEFRLGAANGGTVSGKADVKQTSIGMRSSVPRPELENASFFLDKRDQINLEQERTNVKAFNKANVPEDFISGTPSSTPTPKLHAAARGPRSGSGFVPKLSQVQRPTFSNGLDSPHGTSKNTGVIGSTNRKRSQSTDSSSPPVAQWGDRRPHKIPRTARRTKLVVPAISSNDEVPASSNSEITVSEKGRGSARRYLGNSHKQFKSKADHRQSSTLSESEESGAAEIRSRDNGSKSEEVQKMSTLVLPTRKNKLMNEDELTPGVCRQGRTGRGFSSVRSVGKVGKVKQLRTGRVGFDKAESKLGRPPTRKLSGRKAPRQKHSTFTATTDFLSTDDGHGELLAAANAVINPGCALSSPFWRLMDPLFGFVSDAAVAYVKQEVMAPANTTNPIDSCYAHPNGTMSFEPHENGKEIPEYLTSGSSPRGISICQRLLTALISEEDNNDDLKFNVYGSAFEPETNVESDAVNRRSLQSFELDGSYSSGYRIESTLRSCNELVRSQPESHVMDNYKYSNMSMDERILIEIHRLGLYPSQVPDLVHPGDEDVSNDISRLQEKHNHQVSRKKTLLNKLLNSTEKARELQEKDFERLSLEKLTGMAYQKYMNCWGPSATGGKGAGGKMAKQAALDCVKRTLERCHDFEATGKSCFAEPMFREMFLSGLSRLNDEVDGLIEGIPTEKLSGTQITPDNHGIYPSDSIFAVNQLSEQTIGKDDVWSSRIKKRELYLDDVACTSSGMPSSVGRAVMNSAKGKRSERDRDGKGNGPRNGGPKLGRPSSANANVKGERKTKAKLKQKTTQLSASVNGPLGKISDQQRPTSSSVSKSTEIKSSHINEKHQTMLSDNMEEPLDLSHLQLPGMDDFGVGDDFGGQGEDIGSWLNIEDDVLHDDDFMGLEIPMDDLTDLNMMV
ncbi:hypothetical protein CTI12_AA064260 [Artemisia annua]|uniref:Uncharacterized protein n=1 Tax=Artemisia annua TaxID=35608 RepID=A0A2U1PN95_ARTAN|nr:hypothetical protein CTI12_AA064260 [Artemisia annua]